MASSEHLAGRSGASRVKGFRRPRSRIAPATAAEEEIVDDGVHGERMKPLASLPDNCSLLERRSPATTKSAKKFGAKRHFCYGKENVAPRKNIRAERNATDLSHTTRQCSMDVLFMAIDSCENQEEREVDGAGLQQCTEPKVSFGRMKVEDSLLVGDCLTSCQRVEERCSSDIAEAINFPVVAHENHSHSDDGEDSSAEARSERPATTMDGKNSLLGPCSVSVSCEDFCGFDDNARPSEATGDQGSPSGAGASSSEQDLEASIFASAALKVATHWLEIILSDFKSRLATAKRSRKNVRTVLSRNSLTRQQSYWYTKIASMDTSLTNEIGMLEKQVKTVEEMHSCCLVPQDPVAMQATVNAIIAIAEFAMQQN